MLARGDGLTAQLTIFEAENNIAAYSSALVHQEYRLVLLITPLDLPATKVFHD
jgi:hypothetical protein